MPNIYGVYTTSSEILTKSIIEVGKLFWGKYVY